MATIPPLSKRIVLLTGTNIRHTFFRKYLANYPGISVLRSYLETSEDLPNFVTDIGKEETLVARHLAARKQSEHDFFDLYIASVPDRSMPKVIERGSMNNHAFYEEIAALKADLVITYDSSIIKYPLLSGFKERLIHVHLGLLPFYQGAATNYQPLVNTEPEYVGATFVLINSGIDPGEIIHQIRPVITWGDTPSAIGNRLAKETTETLARLVIHFDRLKKLPQPEKEAGNRLYQQKDFSSEALAQVYQRFTDGLIDTFLKEKEERLEKVPLLQNPVLR